MSILSIGILVRLTLGIFISFFAVGIAYFLGQVILISFALPTERGVQLIAVFSASVGASVGGLLTWLNLDYSWRYYLLLAIVTLALALAGSWAGIVQSRDVVIILGMPGIPELRGALVGAAVGGQLAPMTAFLVRAYLDRRSLERAERRGRTSAR